MGLHDPNICLSCTVYMYSTETWLAQLNKVLCCFVVRARLSFSELLHCVTLKDKLRRLSCRSKKVELSLFMLIGQLLHYPCKIFTEISSRLMRSHWECRDLAEISPWCLLDSKSRRDRGEISISLRLPRTRQDCRDRKSRRVRGEIFYISPRLARSHRETWLFLYLAKILKDANFLPRLSKYNPIIPRRNW